MDKKEKAIGNVTTSLRQPILVTRMFAISIGINLTDLLDN